MTDALALDEAMADRRDRCEIFQRFLADHLFDTAMTDAEFVAQLQARQAALASACQRILALLGDKENGDAENAAERLRITRRNRHSLDRKILPPDR